MNDEKKRVIDETREKYQQLLSNVNPKDLENALEACYEKGMTSSELSKMSYRYLYPVNEPTLY